ncbi:universal stress protein [Streptomyces sp. NPDC005574]|uniref:universal stress protein n=1 Tax=Streptomyces sp. NPDC005574 TaxID=3156891 RepID=UPI0033B7083B
MKGPVVVVVGGSPSSLAAVEAAAWEADHRGVPLLLAHAVAWPTGSVAVGDADGAGWRGVAGGALAEAERHARRVAPGLRMTSEVLVGEPARVLAGESRAATLTVVGGGGEERRGRLHRGPLTGRPAGCGHCPMLVVRGGANGGGPVVLADDGSQAVRAAAEFAFAEASARGAELVVLHTRGHGTIDGEGIPADLREEYAGVTVRTGRTRSRGRRAFVEASAGAQLVVVGVSGHGRVAAELPGSVGRLALRHTACTVAFVPAGREQPWSTL